MTEPSLLMGIFSLIARNSFLIFILAFGAGWMGRSAFTNGERSKAKILIGIAATCSSLLFVLHAVLFLFGHQVTSLIMAAIWGYFAWRDITFLQDIR